jgi:hypothetical protein
MSGRGRPRESISWEEHEADSESQRLSGLARDQMQREPQSDGFLFTMHIGAE